MKGKIDISICVTTFNRKELLEELLKSIVNVPEDFVIEIVITDDGSFDGTKDIDWSTRTCHLVKYFYQNNSGRATALKNSILQSSGEYCVIMDSDDTFTNDAFVILSDYLRSESYFSSSDCFGAFVFGVNIITADNVRSIIPPDIYCNLISLRADSKVTGDLKEVVKTQILKECIYEIPAGIRRVPTSLLWTKVAEISDCKSIPKVIANKCYLPGGMTSKINSLKINNSKPLVDLYILLSTSLRYKSVYFRVRSKILLHRYAFHAKCKIETSLKDKLFVFLGFIIFKIDLYNSRYAE